MPASEGRGPEDPYLRARGPRWLLCAIGILASFALGAMVGLGLAVSTESTAAVTTDADGEYAGVAMTATLVAFMALAISTITLTMTRFTLAQHAETTRRHLERMRHLELLVFTRHERWRRAQCDGMGHPPWG